MRNLSDLISLINETPKLERIKELLKVSNGTEYDCFVMTKNKFVDDFSIRLELNQEMGIVIKGLAETVDKIANAKIDEVLVHSLSLKLKPHNVDLLIYTDIELGKVISVIETSDVQFNQE